MQNNFKNFREPFCDQPLAPKVETWATCTPATSNSDLAIFKSMIKVTEFYRNEDKLKKKKRTR